MSQLEIGKGTVQIIVKDTTITGYEAVIMHNHLSEYVNLIEEKNKLNPFASKQAKQLANKYQMQKELGKLVRGLREKQAKTTDNKLKIQLGEKIQKNENTMEKIADELYQIRIDLTENDEEAEKMEKQSEEFYKKLPELQKQIFDKEVTITTLFLKSKNYNADEIVKTASVGQIHSLIAGIIENEENGLKTDFFPQLQRLKGVRVDEDEKLSKEEENNLINL